MPIRVSNIDLPPDHADGAAEDVALRTLRLRPEQARAVTVRRRSVDARRGRPLRLIYQVDVDPSGDPADALGRVRRGKASARWVDEPGREPPLPGDEALRGTVAIVGAGPCGLFAAYRLAQRGFRPLVIERGKPTERRMKDLRGFRLFGELDPQSNLLFGEGGAGMFSDGKLTTRNRSPFIDEVLRILHEAGAPESILVEARPHVGSNFLPKVLRRMRRTIEAMGGCYRFDTEVVDVARDAGGRIAALVLRDADGHDERVATGAVVLAAGGSARELFVRLDAAGIALEARPTLMGVRVEHPQALIDVNQYGAPSDAHTRLGSAEYFLTLKPDPAMPRPVHSFCMCPGGEVIAIASETGGVSANGMSNYSRKSGFANSAMIAPLEVDDYAAHGIAPGPLAGIAFQRQLERTVFDAGGGDYSLPAQRLDDFFHGRPSTALGAGPKVTRKRIAPVHALLPAPIAQSVRASLAAADRRIPGFLSPDATVYGVEVRTSSPVRIVRGADGQSVNTPDLYPSGEGAGYAGGIMSAALDGIEQADRVIRRFAPA